jgi:hypothetical protein
MSVIACSQSVTQLNSESVHHCVNEGGRLLDRNVAAQNTDIFIPVAVEISNTITVQMHKVTSSLPKTGMFGDFRNTPFPRKRKKYRQFTHHTSFL